MHYFRLNRRYTCGQVKITVTGWAMPSRKWGDDRCSYRGRVTLPSGRVWQFAELCPGADDYNGLSCDDKEMTRRVAVCAMGWADASFEETGVEGQPSRDFTEELSNMADAEYDPNNGETVYNVS